MAPDMIAAPQCDVVANRYEWLDSVCLQAGDIFQSPIVQDSSVGAHIAWRVRSRALAARYFSSHTVQFGVGQRLAHRVGLAEALCDLVEGH